jgi:hypothetical protein
MRTNMSGKSNLSDQGLARPDRHIRPGEADQVGLGAYHGRSGSGQDPSDSPIPDDQNVGRNRIEPE